MQDLNSLQLTPVGYVSRRTRKLEDIMPTGAQVKWAWGHQHFCRIKMCCSVKKLELNWSERKTMSLSNCLIPTPWLNSIVWEEIYKTEETDCSFATLIHDCGIATMLLMPKSGIPMLWAKHMSTNVYGWVGRVAETGETGSWCTWQQIQGDKKTKQTQVPIGTNERQNVLYYRNNVKIRKQINWKWSTSISMFIKPYVSINTFPCFLKYVIVITRIIYLSVLVFSHMRMTLSAASIATSLDSVFR